MAASLPDDGWKLFNTICKKYEGGKLKDQRALPKDLKGKAAFQAELRSMPSESRGSRQAGIVKKGMFVN